MSGVAIHAENLSKRYLIGRRQARYRTLRDSLTDAVVSPLRRAARLWRGAAHAADGDETIWALRDASFTVEQGEVVGIVGRNGAGKSTLLKILTRITEPTEGRATICGRVGSLLEVGTGFHPELTGRENTYLNGAILGMRRAEIQRKLDEIVAFAEVEQFMDTPVKHYSTGMYLRLAFAVAAHLEAEILLIDEVLAVGDAAFQKKCLGKLGDVAEKGRTALFVSHNMQAVHSLCDRAIWLDAGQVVSEGRPTQVIARYLQASFAPATESLWPDVATAPGNDAIRLRRVCVRPEHAAPTDPITVHTPFVIEVEYWNLVPEARLNVSLLLYNEQGVLVFNTGPVNEPVWHGRPFPLGLFRSGCHVPGDLLNDGRYRVLVLIVKNEKYHLYRHEDGPVFDIHESGDRPGAWHGKWPGVVRPNLKWVTDLVELDPSPAHHPTPECTGQRS